MLLAAGVAGGCMLDFPEEWLYASCGDGIVDENEGCDDGDTFAGNGCSATCQVENGYYCTGEPSDCDTECGDGIEAGNEECDDGNTSSGDGCSASCRNETGDCGDGNIDANEGCDDSNASGGDGCSATCQIENGWDCTGVPSQCDPVCGDGLRVGGEACDDDNRDPGDGCSALCTVEHGWYCSGTPSDCVTQCGDGIPAGLEGCDDIVGTPVGGDGCSATCTVEPGWSCAGEPSVCSGNCGDGFMNGVETCDDSNIASGDGCSPTCQQETGWDCTGEPSTCTVPCGDGIVVAGHETCDDGQATPTDGDGCSATCQTEHGWTCTGAPSSCSTTCGDGIPAGAEACDDDNTTPGDGCSATCTVESHFDCTGEPSVCEYRCEVVEALVPQTGCPTGQMCTVNRSTPTIECRAAGSTPDYAACTAWGQCSPGAQCLNTVSQGQFCAPYCVDNADCVADALCLYEFDATDTGGGNIGLCSKSDNCNATLGGVAAGCQAAEGCYLLSVGTWCIQPAGTVAVGQQCASVFGCVPGASCINTGTQNECVELCTLPSGACDAGTCTNSLGDPTYGTCEP